MKNKHAISIKEYEEKYDEIIHHQELQVHEKQNFNLFYEDGKKFIIIKESIEEVLNNLYKKLNPPKNEIKTIPKEFEIPESLVNQLGQELSLYLSFDLFKTDELINLLKIKGSLRKKLGKEEEEKLYNNFYISNIPYIKKNPFSILRNCLNLIIEIRSEKEKQIQNLTIIPNEQKIKTGHQKKKETINWEKAFSQKQKQLLLKQKLITGKTVQEQFIADRMKMIREPIDILEFKHRMNNLARTAFENKLIINQEASKHEIEYRISERKLLEELTGKEYKKLSTYQKNKNIKMLNINRNEQFTFFEETSNEELKVIYERLYDCEEYLLPNGNKDIVIKFNLRGQDFRNKKNYIYSDNTDFLTVKKKRQEFWEYIEEEENKDKYILKIGKLLNRVKNNKIFQAAPIKCLNLLKLNFQKKHPIKLSKEYFDMICGDIKTEAQSKSLARKNRPKLAEAIVATIRWQTFWIAKKLHWIHHAEVSNGNVVMILNYKYFTKQKIIRIK
jgi:hypothetical protein